MGGGAEKEARPKVGLLQKLGRRLGVSKTEEQREREWDAKIRSIVEQATNEPFDIVAQRVEDRIGSPEIRKLLAYRLMLRKELFDRMNGDNDLLLFYKTQTEIGSIWLFGKNHQEIDLNTPLELTEKDMEFVRQLEPVATSLRLGDKSSALENLRRIPRVTGSSCVRGEFDGYNQEALIVTSTSAEMLENVLSTKPKRVGERATYGLSNIVDGFETKDRLTVVKGLKNLPWPSARFFKDN